jgi:hypothetical protein
MVRRAKNSTHAKGTQGGVSDAFCAHQLAVILFSSAGWNLVVMWPKSVIVVAFVVLREAIHVPFGIVQEHATTRVKRVHDQWSLCTS